MEFTDAAGSVERGRFTWISPTTGRYLFTNRQGDMMRDATLIDLAQQLKEQRAVIIRAEADPLFDRVLGELIDKLEAQTAPPERRVRRRSRDRRQARAAHRRHRAIASP
ncbi:MAG: DUF1631 family protein [Proteobacteria bacterium]|nr:DUF1631 family protein [Pseudomonadota bacterium]